MCGEFDLIESTKTTNAQPKLAIYVIKSLVVCLPCAEEQKNIADFLTAVDKKMSLLKRKHSLLQQYKKGVMQHLFSQQIRFKDDNGKDFPDWQEKRFNEFFERV